MPGNPSQLSVVVTTSSPGFAWACLHAARIDASRAAVLTTPGASIGGLEDSLGRTLAAMFGLTQVQQIVVLAHAADPVYRIGAEGLSERAERRGCRPTRAGWGDTIPYPRLAKNAERTVGRAVLAIAGASWLPPQVSVVGIVISEDGSAGTVAVEISGGAAAGGERDRTGPVEVAVDPADLDEPDPQTKALDHSWLHDAPVASPDGDAPGSGDLFGSVTGAAVLGVSSVGEPGPDADSSRRGPLGADRPVPSGPTDGAGPLATGPMGAAGPLTSGPGGGGGPLGAGPAHSGGPLTFGPRSGEGPLATGSAAVGGPLVNAAIDGPLSGEPAGASEILGDEGAAGGGLGSSPSALETLPVASVESLASTPVEEGTAPSGDRKVSARRSSTSRRQADGDLAVRLERSAAILARFVRERCYQHSLRRDMKHLIRTGASPETVMRNLLALVRDLGDDLPEVRAAYGTLEMAQSAVDRRTLETLLRTIVL